MDKSCVRHLDVAGNRCVCDEMPYGMGLWKQQVIRSFIFSLHLHTTLAILYSHFYVSVALMLYFHFVNSCMCTCKHGYGVACLYSCHFFLHSIVRI